MNSLVLLIVCVAILGIGYVCYGGWLCKQWGVGESKTETPAHTMADGVDYVPAKAPVLMGHHFSSIAGAGPITGPIGAAMFGWLPVTLWILIGGIFFGGVHDFGALFASVRSKGQSIGEIISANMSKRAKQLFIIFSYLTLILVVAAFASIVASTFQATYVDGVVLVTKSGYTTSDELNAAIEAVHQAGGNLCGVVLNDLNMKSVKYSYKYKYSDKYGYKYGYRYGDKYAYSDANETH